MKRLWNAWIALWDRREPATALALVRILLASVLLIDYLWLAKLGMVHALYAPPPTGFAVADAVVWYGVLIASLACAAIGAATPLACIGVVVATVQLSAAAPDSEAGSDVLARIVFLILALSRCNARWSVDAWVMRRLGRPLSPDVPAWPRYLLLLQLVWVYFSAATNKSSAAWGPHGGFTALATTLLDPQATWLSPNLVVLLYPLTRVATALTMVFELSAPLYMVALWRDWRRVRIAWLALFFAFELGIATTMTIGSFPFVMLALSPVLIQRLNTRAPANRASSPS
ncbi:MAG: HTTM domain-containing protein [Deltaproteobacteria bacterium]|nr:HTTM domain-containing protein [Deltaproteobacteria bacterium]